jgi:arsenic resistance protein ArsH
MPGHGDLNNAHAARQAVELSVDDTYNGVSLAIKPEDDDTTTRERYRPFLLKDGAEDWVADLELSTTLQMVESEILGKRQDRLRILVLYGSLRNRYVNAAFAEQEHAFNMN